MRSVLINMGISCFVGQRSIMQQPLAHANTNCPDVFRLQRTLLADQATLVSGVERLRGRRVFGGHGPLRRSRPLPPQRQIAVGRPGTIPEKALTAVSGHASTPAGERLNSTQVGASRPIEKSRKR